MTRTNIAHALAVLDISGSDFVTMLNAAGGQGRRTTRATVSRWMNEPKPDGKGKLRGPPPLAIQLALKTLLIEKIRRGPPGFGSMKVVTVGGGKGGAGATAMCAFLAAAAKGLGFRVRLGATRPNVESLARWARDCVGPFGQLGAVDLSKLTEEKRRFDGCFDLMIVDVGSASMISEVALDAVELHQIDLAVVPNDPLARLDFESARMVMGAFDAHGFDRFLLQPVVDRTSFASMLMYPRTGPDFGEHADKLSEAPVFKRTHVEQPRFFARGASSFQDDDLESEYLGVLHEILRRVGVSATWYERDFTDLGSLDLDGLLALFDVGPETTNRAGKGSLSGLLR